MKDVSRSVPLLVDAAAGVVYWLEDERLVTAPLLVDGTFDPGEGVLADLSTAVPALAHRDLHAWERLLDAVGDAEAAQQIQARAIEVGVQILGHRYETLTWDWPPIVPTGRPGQDVGPVRHVVLGDGPVSVSDLEDVGASRLD